MEVSSNWKKYVEVIDGKAWKVIFLIVVIYFLYLNLHACNWQVAKTGTDQNSAGNKPGSRDSTGSQRRKRRKNQRNSQVHRCRDNSPPEERRITNAVALDCEMVGIQDGKESMLARVSIVNSYGHTLYDTFVKPTEPVVDYRTHVSGVRPKDLENAADFHDVQKAVAEILKGRILVGHALCNDLKVLFLGHPRRKIRDTAKYRPFRKFNRGKTPSLKKLANQILGIKLQEGEHSSVEDARAAMQLYNMYKKEWERSLYSRS